MLQVSHANVSKLDINFSMLQTLISMLWMSSFDVVDAYYWVLPTLNFNVADVEYRCCRHVMLVFVLRRGEGKLLMLDVAHNTGRNMVAI
jgi:hypothetical protein